MSAVAGRVPVQIGGLTDDELVQLARAGDEAAFDAIVYRYRAPLVSYCRRWVDAHRAEEVVQHTLMKAFLCVRDDHRPLALRPWLYRVAHNAALNALEKKGSEWEELDENYDGVPQPPQVAEQRARFLQVVGEIEALPDRQREALLLNEFEGRCYADIATELGTSESGVRGLLRRARRQLRDAAAAVLLPVPLLRELVRADGRGLPVERAGELVGTAGAAGGIGAAGGLAKVAAGVLAAGTIAGGGAAIERGGGDPAGAREKQQPPAAESAERPVVAAADGVGRSVLAAGAANRDRGAAPADAEAVAGAGGLIAAGGLTSGGRRAPSFGGIESEAAAPQEAGTVEPTPLIPIVPLVPVGEQPAKEEQPAAEEQPAEETEQSEQADSERPSTETRDQAATDSDPDTAESSSPTDQAEPAGPLAPQRY